MNGKIANPALTITEFASLCARSATIHFNRASLTIKRLPVAGADGLTERRFVMEGPSGVHTLLVDATDQDRLNAHWSVFATDARNAYQAPATARAAQRREVAQMQAQR